jgi:hypothetical protein
MSDNSSQNKYKVRNVYNKSHEYKPYPAIQNIHENSPYYNRSKTIKTESKESEPYNTIIENLKEIQEFMADKCNVNPIHSNKPLPNSSQIIYSYGAMAYISDAYPGYVWRNGHWYSIKNNLQFDCIEEKKLKLMFLSKIDWADETKKYKIEIDDTFLPIIINGIRYFIKPNIIFKNYAYNTLGQINCCYIYTPSTKKTHLSNGDWISKGVLENQYFEKFLNKNYQYYN